MKRTDEFQRPVDLNRDDAELTLRGKTTLTGERDKHSGEWLSYDGDLPENCNGWYHTGRNAFRDGASRDCLTYISMKENARRWWLIGYDHAKHEAEK